MNAHNQKQLASKEDVLKAIVDEISIPDGYVEKARTRYKSIGTWFDRPASSIKHLNPKIHAQGSFALGTVIRPLDDADEYDVDLVCRLEKGSRHSMSQADLKAAIGVEIIAYARANGMKNFPEDGRRCWTMEYADEARFHMDILPGIPDQEGFLMEMTARGHQNGAYELASSALGITDKKHPQYRLKGGLWLVSNPEGYIKWFRSRQVEVLLREMKLTEARTGMVFASVEDFPNHRVRTPLQDAIKILKRHRDAMFKGDENKPISIIISTLAAHAYGNQTTIAETLKAILPAMKTQIDPLGQNAVIANPSYPAENFADKWAKKPQKQRNFERWITQAHQDILGYLLGNRYDQLTKGFESGIGENTVPKIRPRLGLSAAMLATAAQAVAAEVSEVKLTGAATKPWYPDE